MAAGSRLSVPLYDGMNRIPGGLMLIPLILGSIVGTFFADALAIGSFTTALFQNSALPLIALLIFATGTQVTARTTGPVLAHAGVVLLTKSLIPAALVIGIGLLVGLDGILGVSILALLVAVDNSNGGLWLAFTGRYGDYRDRGAYIASAVNDGPFLSLLFLGASGLADIPLLALVGAVVPFVLGMIVGNLDPKWKNVLLPVPAIVIPFFAFALGTGINLGNVVAGGAQGLIVGLIVAPFTGFLVYLGYRFLLRRGRKSGLGFAAGTTAGNAIATPAIVGAIDERFAPYVEVATAQVAASVLVTAILAPLIASLVLKRNGALTSPEEEQSAEADDHSIVRGGAERRADGAAAHDEPKL
ncbi:2-keto-3-deoxygluconate permease [Microcella daejeonensis]|uniref:2-keto-3-deoxygluconate permease n=1 Tax=Microcella daejeonensis TaxID=2994971 RepID=A0A9E8MK26_9MICO|nr:2-keto-3-deoxygluconate permease [Microcella daejeonensis]WAB81009.1 2-keto-3-deoxygluconate permease [Microcella daejeonensis]